MGGAVSISAPKENQDKLKDFLKNKKVLNALFAKIAKSGQTSGKIDLKGKISLQELMTYYRDPNRHAIFKLFNPEISVCKEAFIHITKNKTGGGQLTKKQFPRLIETLFLFSELWVIFDLSDSLIVDDQKIFKGEYMLAREKLSSVSILSLPEISKEQWEAEFVLLDKDKSGYITFDELCQYVMNQIVDASSFTHAFDDEVEVVDADETAEDGTAVTATVVETVGQEVQGREMMRTSMDNVLNEVELWLQSIKGIVSTDPPASETGVDSAAVAATVMPVTDTANTTTSV